MLLILNTMTGTTHSKEYVADQLTVNYIEDSNHCAAIEDPTKLKAFLNIIFKVIVTFFNINKLVINQDKTSLILNAHPRNRHITKDITIESNENNEDIIKSDCIKILGFLTNTKNRQDSSVNQLIGDTSAVFAKLSHVKQTYNECNSNKQISIPLTIPGQRQSQHSEESSLHQTQSSYICYG